MFITFGYYLVHIVSSFKQLCLSLLQVPSMVHKLQQSQNSVHYVILTSVHSQPHIHALYTDLIRTHSISAEADQ